MPLLYVTVHQYSCAHNCLFTVLCITVSRYSCTNNSTYSSRSAFNFLFLTKFFPTGLSSQKSEICCDLALLHLILEFIKIYNLHKYIGPGSSVGIATELRACRSGVRILVEPRILRTFSDRPWGPSTFLYNDYLFFPRVKATRTCCSQIISY